MEFESIEMVKEFYNSFAKKNRGFGARTLVQLNKKEQYWCVAMKVTIKSQNLRMKKIKITVALLKIVLYEKDA